MNKMMGLRIATLIIVKGVGTKTNNNGRMLTYLIPPRGARKADRKAAKANIGKVEIRLSPPKKLPTMLAKVM